MTKPAFYAIIANVAGSETPADHMKCAAVAHLVEGAQFYLLTDTGVECFSTDGTSQWTQSLSARPQGLLADRRQLLVFCGNTVQVLTPPAAENNAQSNT